MILETSADIGDIFTALAKAQGEIKNAIRDEKNDHFRSKYATLDACFDACRSPLSKAGIAIVQAPFNDGDDVGIMTILGVASGQWMRSRLQVAPTKYDAQGVGSIITYLRRYALCAMVGVAPGDDDDGEAAVGRPRGESASRQGTQERRTEAPASSSRGSERRRDERPSGERTENGEKASASDGRAKKDVAQAAYDRLNIAIKDALDHQMLDDIETKMSADLELLREFAKTAYETVIGRISQKREDITRGPKRDDGPGDEP